jgi:hypothetical protein
MFDGGSIEAMHDVESSIADVLLVAQQALAVTQRRHVLAKEANVGLHANVWTRVPHHAAFVVAHSLDLFITSMNINKER